MSVVPKILNNLFRSFETKYERVSCFTIKDKNGYYITKEVHKQLLNHIDALYTEVEATKESDDKAYESYYMGLLSLVDLYRKLQQYEYDREQTTYTVMDCDLNTAQVYSLRHLKDIDTSHFKISFNNQIDYLSHKDKFQELINGRQAVKEGIKWKCGCTWHGGSSLFHNIESDFCERCGTSMFPKEKEDIILERNKLVLTFNHPEGFVDEDGSYNYPTIESSLFEIDTYLSIQLLEQAVRAYQLRLKTRQHYANLNKIEYNYQEMKQKRKDLHKEFYATYKFFSRLIRIRYDTPIAVTIPQK